MAPWFPHIFRRLLVFRISCQASPHKNILFCFLKFTIFQNFTKNCLSVFLHLHVSSNNSSHYFQMFLQYRSTIQRGCSIIIAILDEHVGFIFRVELGETGHAVYFVEKWENYCSFYPLERAILYSFFLLPQSIFPVQSILLSLFPSSHPSSFFAFMVLIEDFCVTCFPPSA